MDRAAPKGFIPEPFYYHEEVEMEVDTLTNQAHGLGRVNGWVVMVRFALPGERVRVRIYKNYKNYSEADLVAVITPSPDRIIAPCPLFKGCGGCQYQHLAYPAQLKWKTQQVQELLKHLAGAEAVVKPAWPSPRPYHYRSKLTPHYPKPRGDAFPIGFLKEGSAHSIVDVPACPIATEAINEALPGVRATLTARQGQLKKGGTLLFRDAEAGVETNPRALVAQVVGPWRFEFLAGDFFQNNPYILPDFVEYVTGQAQAGGVRYLIDAYCGGGLFGIASSRAFERFMGVELSSQAVASARKNAALNGVINGEFIVGQAEAIFESVTFPATETAVVLDPPRKGCDRIFLDQLLAYSPARIVYVSCDPATQARDLAILLQGGYTLTAVQPFDLFPQTKHIESIATLSRS